MSLPKLTEEDIQTHLTKLPDWAYDDNALNKMFTFSNFVTSIRFVNAVASAAESVNHHPDIYIRYNRVTLTLTTHDTGGVTLNDVQLAAACDDIADTVAK